MGFISNNESNISYLTIMINNFPKNKIIILLGTFPPPIGGVSIYLSRISKLFLDNNYTYFKWDISKGRKEFLINFLKYFKKCLFNKNCLLNINAISTKIIISILVIKSFTNSEIYTTLHNVWYIQSISRFKKFLLKLLISKTTKLIVVNDEIFFALKEKGFVNIHEIIVQNAFIPPPIEEEKLILDTYSNETLEFINSKRPLLIANAFKIVFLNNVDLYGLDLCVKLTQKLKKIYPKIGFIFALANSNENKNYLEKVMKEIDEFEISENFHFLTDQKQIWPIFKKTNLMIRPTYSDGYGFSIDEALLFGCPALASNVCKRADGTILFENRNIDDLFEKSLKILKESKI